MLEDTKKTEQDITEVNKDFITDNNKTFKIWSPSFQDMSHIPEKHTCDGQNISPELRIENVPNGTKSLVLIMFDPDAPTGNYYHWITFNIDPSTKIIKEGNEPEGISGKGTNGNLDYFGPCPPDGEHRYVFILYALDYEFDLPEGVRMDEIREKLDGKIISKTILTGLYSRN